MASLTSLGHQVQLVPLKTTGDVDLVNPIYAMGVTGVFTRELDTALLSNHAELAVHSLKDVPTILPKGLTIAAVFERASYDDILVYKPGFQPDKNSKAVIATSSIRRRSQWLQRYPLHEMVNVRGNVATRLKKFNDEGWDGIIFAKAGLERLQILPENHWVLPWMIPAPAQGAIAVVCRENNDEALKICAQINQQKAAACVLIERDFLFYLDGGCSVPISALATINGDEIHFTGAVHSLDGTREMKVEMTVALHQGKETGKMAADQIRGAAKGREILAEFRTLNRKQHPS